jgi:Ca2+-binding EF-hand superfamily protein
MPKRNALGGIKKTQFSKEEIEMFNEIFKKYDKDKSGTLEGSELTKFCKECVTESVAGFAVFLFDDNGDGKVSFDEFVELLNIIMKSQSDPLSLVRAVATRFDKDKSGYLDFEEFKKFSQMFKMNMDDSEIKSFLKQTGGKISLQGVYDMFGA